MTKVKFINVMPTREQLLEHETKQEVYEVCHLPYGRVNSNDFLVADNEEEIKERIKKVIQVEAPITEWLLIKRVINSFGIQKAGVHIREKMFSILDSMNLHKDEEYDTTVYWRKSQNPSLYATYRVFGYEDESCRDVTNVPIKEVVNAVVATNRKHPALKDEELARETANLLGYTRMGTNVRRSMKQAIAYAKEMQWLNPTNPKKG